MNYWIINSVRNVPRSLWFQSEFNLATYIECKICVSPEEKCSLEMFKKSLDYFLSLLPHCRFTLPFSEKRSQLTDVRFNFAKRVY